MRVPDDAPSNILIDKAAQAMWIRRLYFRVPYILPHVLLPQSSSITSCEFRYQAEMNRMESIHMVTQQSGG